MRSFIWPHNNTMTHIGLYDYIYNQGSFSGLFQETMMKRTYILSSTLHERIQVSKFYFFHIQLHKAVFLWYPRGLESRKRILFHFVSFGPDIYIYIYTYLY